MTGNPWDIQDPIHLDLTPEETYAAVGQALSTWEKMEYYFCHLFGFFTSGNDAFVAERAYGSVISFNGRSELLASAGEAYFHTRAGHKMETRFDEIRKMAKKYSPRRNEIAHGVVQVVVLESPKPPEVSATDHFIQSRRYLLLPSDYSTNKNALVPLREDGKFPAYRTQGRYAYSSRDIRIYSDQFAGIRSNLGKLIEDWQEAYPNDSPALPGFPIQ